MHVILANFGFFGVGEVLLRCKVLGNRGLNMKQKMSYKSITPSIGAEVSGLDCSNVDTNNQIKLQQLLVSQKVLVFRDQMISPLEFL